MWEAKESMFPETIYALQQRKVEEHGPRLRTSSPLAGGDLNPKTSRPAPTTSRRAAPTEQHRDCAMSWGVEKYFQWNLVGSCLKTSHGNEY